MHFCVDQRQLRVSFAHVTVQPFDHVEVTVLGREVHCPMFTSILFALQEELMYRRQITTSTQEEVLLLPLLRDVGVVIPQHVDDENAHTL